MRRALAAALFVAVALAPLAAQDDRDAEWRASFELGLTLLRARKLDDAVKAFEKCVELFPDRAVGHYDAACAHALAGRKEKAVACLSRSFEHGFLDLAHVARDHDLDPLRDDPAFTKLVATTRETLLRDARWKIAAPENVEKPPLVVWLHDDGEDAASAHDRLASLARELGAIVAFPEGRLKVRGGRRWDSAAETVVVHVIEAIGAERKLEGKPVIAGVGDGASVAWRIVRASPASFRGAVLASGNLAIDDDDGTPSSTGLRFWISAPGSEDDPLGRVAIGARAKLVDDGAEVVLDRVAGAPPVDRRARALSWVLGGKLDLDRSLRRF
jgi:predicted esterase